MRAQDKMRDKENKLQRLADIFNSNEADRPSQTLINTEKRSAPRSVSELQSLYHTPSRAPATAARVSFT